MDRCNKLRQRDQLIQESAAARFQIDVTRVAIGTLYVIESCLHDRWPRLWFRKIMWSLAMVASMRSGNHRAIMSLIDSSSIPRDRKQAELSLKSVDPLYLHSGPFLATSST
jgi:hypothetical protein